MAVDPKRKMANAEVEALETQEWIDSLAWVLQHEGPDRVRRLLQDLQIYSRRSGVQIPFSANTPYINTIPARTGGPLSREAGRSSGGSRASSAGTRWPWWCGPTARSAGIGGHISTYASAATLYEVGFNHFFQAGNERTLRRRPGLFSGPRLARHLCPGVSGGPASTRNSWRTSAASCGTTRGRACPPIRTPG